MSNNPNLSSAQAEANGRDKRTFARAPSNFRAVFRRLSDPEEPQIAPRTLAVGDSNAKAKFENSGAMPEAVTKFLLQLDAKVDTILMHMRQDSLLEYFPEAMMVHEVSASGLLAQSANLQVGDYIEIVMFISEFPSRISSAIGQVLRPKAVNDLVYAIKFTSIRQSDREELVRFVFELERERIRTEKLKN